MTATSASLRPDGSASTAALSRRSVIAGAAALAAPFIVIPGRARGAGRIVAVNAGGEVDAAKRKAIYEPFTRDTGIEVVSVPGLDVAKMRAQVQSGDVEWDVVDMLGTGGCLSPTDPACWSARYSLRIEQEPHSAGFGRKRCETPECRRLPRTRP